MTRGTAHRAVDNGLSSNGHIIGHLDALREALDVVNDESGRIDRWAGVLAEQLTLGARLLVAGNGGSAAEAQHLTAELVGRYVHDRPAYSALALNAETSSLTAIGNDYGFEQVYARQIEAHARVGDVVLLLSTSGRSPNLRRAAAAAHGMKATVWALTGPAPNTLAAVSDDAICLPGQAATVQEAQLVIVHLLCAAFDRAVSGLVHVDQGAT